MVDPKLEVAEVLVASMIIVIASVVGILWLKTKNRKVEKVLERLEHILRSVLKHV